MIKIAAYIMLTATVLALLSGIVANILISWHEKKVDKEK